MAEPSGPVNGQNRVVEGLVTTGGVAGLKKGGNAAAVTGSAYQALDTIVGGAGTAGTPAPDVVTVQGIASGTPMQDNITQVGGAAIALGQAAMTSSLPVAIANNQSAIPANVTQIGGVSVGSNGAVAPTYPLTVAGSDGTLLHTMRTATNGDVIIEGLGTAGTPAGNVLSIQGPVADFTGTLPAPVAIGGWDPNNSRTKVMSALGDQLGNGDPAVNFAGIQPLIIATVPYIRGGTPSGNALYQERGNVDYTLLASAARTATIDTTDQTNYNGRGAHIVVDVTAVSGTTPTLIITVQGKDSASGKYYTILQGATISATGTYVYRVYPGETVTANLSASDVLPRTWRVDCAIGGTTPSFTFSVGASNII